jgi:tRNA A37 threonylcarbamoyltransferase TsaD
LWVGGGVSANIEVRRRLRALCQPLGIKVLFPYSQKLNGDNAAMVGACAALKIKYQKLELKDFLDYSKVDREPTLKI